MLDQDITVPEPSTSSSSQIISIDPSHTTTAAEAFGSSGVVGVEANNNNNKRRNKTGKKNARPSWSCVECSRRKVRCSKVIPCEGCIKRGQAATCRLEEEDPESAITRDPLAIPRNDTRAATPAEYTAIRESVVNLRQRLHHLENLVARFTPTDEEDGEKMYVIERLSEVPEGGAGGRSGEKRRRVEEDGGGGGEGRGSREDTMAVGGGLGRERSNEDGVTNAGTATGTGGLPESDEEVEAAVKLEFVALGRDRKDDHHNRSGVLRHDQPPLDINSWASALPSAGNTPTFGVVTSTSHVDPSSSSYPAHPSISSPRPDIFPSRQLSDFIVRFSLERVAWHYGCVHAGTFKSECEEFWNLGEQRGALVNPAWLAFYYAILCAGVQHMSLSDAQRCGLGPDELRALPKQYFDSCVDSLYRADFLAKHSVLTVQAIVVLVVTCQSLGPSDLVATLLSTGIRIAQHLNLHRLGKDSDWQSKRRREKVDPFSPEGIKGLVDREVRKRIWCALTTEDWVSVPYRRSYAIFPDHVTSPPPLNVHDEDLQRGSLIPRSPGEATIVSKILLSLRIASCVRRLFDGITSSGTHSLELVLKIDQEVRDIMASVPDYLNPAADLGHLPPYVDWQRYNWQFQVQHTILVIHRPFLGRSFKDPRYAFSRKAASDSSRAILYQLASGSTRETPHLWTVPYHGVAAATCLLLDVFQSSTSDPPHETMAKRNEVHIAVAELHRLATNSPIAARGVQLLESLLHEEKKRQSPKTASGAPHHRQAISNVRGEKPRDFSDMAHRASLAVSSSDKSTSNQTSPASLSAVVINNFSPDPMQMDDGSALSQTMLDQILFSGMGAPLGGAETPVPTNDGTVDFWALMQNGYEQSGHQDLGMGSPGRQF